MFRIPTTENTLHLLSDVRRGQWFVHDYESLLPVALSFLRGEKIPEAAIRPTFEFSASEAESPAAISGESKAKQVAVIPIVGTITKYDSCFTTGAITYARAIMAAANHPDIGATVLDIDSGGGAGNAIAVLKEAIHYTQSLGKPIVAHVDFCASLAYWVASQCDAIFCDNPLSAVGSIGGLYQIVDDTGKMEKEGYTVITVYADESADKNLDYRMALEGDNTLLKKKSFLQRRTIPPRRESRPTRHQGGRRRRIHRRHVPPGRGASHRSHQRRNDTHGVHRKCSNPCTVQPLIFQEYGF